MLTFVAVFIFSCNAVGDKTTLQDTTSQSEEPNNQTDTFTTQPTPHYDTQAIKNAEENMYKQQTTSDDDVREKLKAQAEKDWPNDYTTQEYWINTEIEDYEYMKTIPDDAIKEKAQQDWPLDFTTQKYWYNQQIEAKKRLQ